MTRKTATVLSKERNSASPAHFLTLWDLGETGIREVIEEARVLKSLQASGTVHRRLEGRTLGMIFEKASTRTRVSFEVGMFQLGGHAVNLTNQSSQIGRGEPVEDTARVLSRYVDLVMIRTFSHEGLESFAHHSRVPVINGLTDAHHPCQLLADLMTVQEFKDGLAGLKYAWLGDGNNMAHSWIEAASVLGLDLTLATPKAYGPNPQVLEQAKARGRGKIRLVHRPEEAVEDADVVSTDVWASMGDEHEAEARRKAFKGYTLDAKLMKAAAKQAIVLHCLPAHRGEEIDAEVMESHAEVIFTESENRLHSQKALMCRLMGV